MNILFICDEYPPGKNGGIGSAVQNLARELVQQGHKAYVAGLYTYAYGGKDFEMDDGVSVWRFRYGLNLIVQDEHVIYKLINRLPGVLKKYLNGIQAYNRFLKFLHHIISQQKIDIIEIADWNTFAMRVGFKVEWPTFSVPLVVKAHGSYTYFEHEMNRTGKKQILETDIALYKRANAVSAVSRYAAEKTAFLFGIKMPIKVLYNGLKLQHVPVAQQEPVEPTVVFTGSLIEKKGIFQLAKAWNLVVQKIPEAKLFIYGKGNKEAIIKLLNPASMKSVIFKGHVKKEAVLNALKMATLAVLPSYSETFGLAAAEAMAQGCPVIFTQRSSGPEVIENKQEGELVDPDNVVEIADRIYFILKSTELQKKYAVNGRNKVEKKFNIETSVSEHIQFYSSVINYGIKK